MTVTAEIEYARSLVTSDEGIWMYVHDAQLIGTVYHTTGLVGDEGTPMEEWVKADVKFNADDPPQIVDEGSLTWVGDELIGDEI